METLAIRALLVVLGVAVSAWTRMNAVILGRPVSVPWLGIVAAVVALALAVAALWVVRVLVRELRPGTAAA